MEFLGGGGSVDYDDRRRVSFSDDDTTFFYNDNFADEEPQHHGLYDSIVSEEIGNEFELASDTEMVKLIDHKGQNENIAAEPFTDDDYNYINDNINIDDNDGDDHDSTDVMNVIREAASEDVEMSRQRVFQEVLGSLRRTRSSALDRARKGMTDLEEYYESELDMVRAELERKRKEQADAVAELQDLKERFQYGKDDHQKKTTKLIKEINDDGDTSKSKSIAIGNLESSCLESVGNIHTRMDNDNERYIDTYTTKGRDTQEYGAKHSYETVVSEKASASPHNDSLNQDIISQLQLTIRSRDDEITALLNDNTNLQSQIIAEKQSYHDNEKMKDTQLQNESLQYATELKRLNTTIATYEQERNDNQQSISKMESKIATLEEEALAHKKTIEKSKIARNLLEQENENFRRRIDSLKFELNSEARRGSEATRKLILYEESLKELQAKYKVLKESALSFQSIDDQIDTSSNTSNNNNHNNNNGNNSGRFHAEVDENNNNSISRQQNLARQVDPHHQDLNHIERYDTFTHGRIQRMPNTSQNSTQARQLLENSLSDVIIPTQRISKTKNDVTSYHSKNNVYRESLPQTTTIYSQNQPHNFPPPNISTYNDDANNTHIETTTTQKRLFVNDDRDEQSLYSKDFKPEAAEEALHNKENNGENSIPFATEESLRASMELTAAIEHELMALNQEHDQLETVLAKLPLNAGKTLAQRRRKIDTEERLDVVKKSIAKLRMKMRRMHVL